MAEPEVSSWLRRRWVLDRIIAALAGTILAPVAALLGVLIRRDSPGGATIGLKRIGEGRRPFTMWKLRSMRAASADGSAGGAVLTMGDDDRITPIGAKLRRLRLDELPQLWNILRGDMALIGPRPETPSYVDDDSRWDEVLAARPGIAGPTQLMVHDWEAELPDAETYGRVVLPVKLAIDAWYVRTASPVTDLLVVAGLAQSLIGGKAETVLHRRVRREVPESAAIPRSDAVSPSPSTA